MRGPSLLWVLLGGLLVTVVVLAAFHEQGEVAGLKLDQAANLVALVSIGIFILAMAWPMFRGRLSQSLKAAAFWLVLAALLAVAYTYRAPLQSVADRVLGELVPGHPVSRAQGEQRTAEVTRGTSGEFAVNARVNGTTIPMLVDTGASAVVLTHEDAKAAGLPVDRLTYDVPVETANGRARAAATVIDTLIVGGIVEKRVPAYISQHGALRGSLLGMSFLSRLDSFVFRGDRLILRGPAAP